MPSDMNIVHIGLPKTGSTTLQNNAFAARRDFVYVGKYKNAHTDERGRELITRISTQDSLEYDPIRTAVLVDQLRVDAKPFLISDEILSMEGRADRRLIAERLRQLFSPAKILIVLRAQPAMCQSMYLNHLRASRQRITSFAAWLEETYGGIAFSDIDRVALNYEPLVATYEDYFGAENVVVLPFELMKDENSKFSATLAELLNMPLAAVQSSLKSVDNQRMSHRHLLALHVQDRLPKGTNLALIGRRLLPSSMYEPIRRFVTSGSRVPSPGLPGGWEDRVAAICARGNAAIEARKAVPLRALGYPVAADAMSYIRAAS
jgi:hypothetical protein